MTPFLRTSYITVKYQYTLLAAFTLHCSLKYFIAINNNVTVPITTGCYGHSKDNLEHENENDFCTNNAVLLFSYRRMAEMVLGKYYIH